MNLAKKFSDMEALRGFAALGVVVYHFLHGFIPPVYERNGASVDDFLAVDRPFLLAFINGPFMVSIFFVLSSFVLTTRLVREPNRRTALIAMVKRFPRLFPLTLIGSMLPAFLFAAGLMYNDNLASMIQSPWLERSGGVKVSAGWPEPSIAGGMVDSLLLFKRGLSQYNSALWTMKFELIGSLFALATAVMFGARQRIWTDAAITLVLGTAALWIHPLISICVATVFLTKYLSAPDLVLGRRTVGALVISGLILGSTYKSLPEELLIDPWVRTQVLRVDWLIHGAGAMLLFLGVRGAASRRLQESSLGRHLGRLSFPMYVLHLPIFASIGSGIIIAAGYSGIAVVLAFFSSMIVLIAASVPVAKLDEWWVARLNAFVRRTGARSERGPVALADPAP